LELENSEAMQLAKEIKTYSAKSKIILYSSGKSDPRIEPGMLISQI